MILSCFIHTNKLGGFLMKVSYKKLWILCAEQEISKGELRKRTGISTSTFTKLRKNQEVALSILMKIAEMMLGRKLLLL